MNSAQLIPPKMLAQLAERARRGDYDEKLGSDIYSWFSGRTKTTIIGLDRPVGTVSRVSVREAEAAQKRKAISQ